MYQEPEYSVLRTALPHEEPLPVGTWRIKPFDKVEVHCHCGAQFWPRMNYWEAGNCGCGKKLVLWCYEESEHWQSREADWRKKTGIRKPRAL